MRVCQYIPHGSIPDIRGFAPAVVAQMFYKYLPENIEHYFVSNLENYTIKVENTEFGKVFRIGESPLYRRLFRKITKLDPYPLHKRLAKIINANPVDILHIHQLEFPIDKFKKLLRDKDIKIIIHAHVIVNKFDYKNGVANCYIAVSNFTKNIMVTKNNYPKYSIKVVSNGVDTNLFKPLKIDNKIHNIKDKFNIAKNKILISFIGRKHTNKGFGVFLQVANYLLNKYDNILFLAVGQEPNDNEIEIINTRKKLVNNYIDLSPLQHTDLAKIYQISDIVLLPTKQEAQGMTVIESIASGCITISSKVGGVMDSITDNYNGFLLNNYNDVRQTIKMTEHTIKNINELDYLRNNAREVAVNTFDWQISTNKLIKIYQNTLGE